MKENKQKSCFSFLLLMIAFVFMLSACQKNLYQDLSEQQVNEMLALLLKYEMKAEKVSQGKGLFTLTIDEKELIP
jgi:type III secretion protein J